MKWQWKNHRPEWKNSTFQINFIGVNLNVLIYFYERRMLRTRKLVFLHENARFVLKRNLNTQNKR